MRKFLFMILFLFGALFASPDEVCRRIQAHLLVGNSKNAAMEALDGCLLYPESQKVFMMAIKSLAANGDLEEMMSLWEKFSQKFPDESENHDLLEDMCFGILQKGQKSKGMTPQLISLIGSALTHDIRAVRFLLEGMRHSNAIFRTVSVELSSFYGDHILRKEIVRLFREEKILEVRLEVIKAIGKLKLEDLDKELIELISSPGIGALEKRAAISALVNMKASLDKKQLNMLLQSPRSGLRLLGSEIIFKYEMKEHVDLLLPLLKDPQAEVQISVLRTLALLKIPLHEDVKHLAKNASDPKVAVTAAWVCLISDQKEGEEAMRKWLIHKDENIRQYAAGAIASSGAHGKTLAKEIIEVSEDPYVRANLALALIGQRENVTRACEILDCFLQQSQDKWMREEERPFSVLQKSTHTHKPSIANFPEVVDQTVRLELLNLLAILEYPKAEASMKDFLKKGHYQVTGLAAEKLLGEGDESALQHIRDLLKDKDKEIRFEAALVLATWGKDPEAIAPLVEMYPQSDRQLQIKILEALGRIGDKKTISFLIERLKEPSLVIRLIAASVLLQTLNN